MREYSNIYIDGSWIRSDGEGSIEVINAGTEEVMGSIPDGVASDVDKAVEAARNAFDGWSQTPVEERQKFLVRLNEALQSRSAEIAETRVGRRIIERSTEAAREGLEAEFPQLNAALLDRFTEVVPESPLRLAVTTGTGARPEHIDALVDLLNREWRSFGKRARTVLTQSVKKRPSAKRTR